MGRARSCHQSGHVRQTWRNIHQGTLSQNEKVSGTTESTDMSIVENLQVEANATDTNIADVR